MGEQSKSIKMLRIEQVEEKVGYKKSTIFEWMKAGSPRHKSHFPLPRKNGRSNRWFESEIDDFCILEFGGSINHPNVECGRTVNNCGEAAHISVSPQRDAIKPDGKFATTSGKSTLALRNIAKRSASAERDAELPKIEVADFFEKKFAGAAIDSLHIVKAQPFVATDLIAAAQSANPMSDDGMPTTLDDELAAASLLALPSPPENAATAIKQTDGAVNTRVIKVVVAKKRTFIQRN